VDYGRGARQFDHILIAMGDGRGGADAAQPRPISGTAMGTLAATGGRSLPGTLAAGPGPAGMR